jgi:hypothetical protein
MRRRSPYKPRWCTPVPLENEGTVIPRRAGSRYSPELIAETKLVWQPYYPEPLTDEDAREIIENMMSFMRLLSKIGAQPKN